MAIYLLRLKTETTLYDGVNCILVAADAEATARAAAKALNPRPADNAAWDEATATVVADHTTAGTNGTALGFNLKGAVPLSIAT